MHLGRGLLLLTAFVCAFTARAQDQFGGTGFFIGDPTPGKGEPRYDAFVRIVEQRPRSTNVFIDYTCTARNGLFS